MRTSGENPYLRTVLSLSKYLAIVLLTGTIICVLIVLSFILFRPPYRNLVVIDYRLEEIGHIEIKDVAGKPLGRKVLGGIPVSPVACGGIHQYYGFEWQKRLSRIELIVIVAPSQQDLEGGRGKEYRLWLGDTSKRGQNMIVVKIDESGVTGCVANCGLIP